MRRRPFAVVAGTVADSVHVAAGNGNGNGASLAPAHEACGAADGRPARAVAHPDSNGGPVPVANCDPCCDFGPDPIAHAKPHSVAVAHSRSDSR